MFDFLSMFSYPFGFLSLGYMVHVLLISLYCLLLYVLVVFFRKVFAKKLGARANYYSWYIVLLCIPLAGFFWNDAVKVFLFSHYEAGRYEKVILLAVMIWVANVVCKLAALALAGRKVKNAIKQSHPYPDGYGLKQKAGMVVELKPRFIENVNIVYTDIVRSPVSYGLIKKYILLPEGYEHYSEQEMYLLLLHEMAHLKNRDTVKLHLFAFAQSFVWILGLFERKFKRDTEILCDNRVIGIQHQERDAYGDLLLKESVTSSRIDGMAFSNSYRAVGERIQALYSYRPAKHRFTLLTGVVFAAVFFLGSCVSIHRAEWFEYNTHYNTDFDVQLNYYNGTGGETSIVYTKSAAVIIEERTDLALPADHFDGLWHIADGEIHIDMLALNAAVQPLWSEEFELVSVSFSSLNYFIHYDEEYTSSEIGGSMRTAEYDVFVEDFASASEDNRYYSAPLQKRGIDEFSLLLMFWLA